MLCGDSDYFWDSVATNPFLHLKNEIKIFTKICTEEKETHVFYLRIFCCIDVQRCLFIKLQIKKRVFPLTGPNLLQSGHYSYVAIIHM